MTLTRRRFLAALAAAPLALALRKPPAARRGAFQRNAFQHDAFESKAL